MKKTRVTMIAAVCIVLLVGSYVFWTNQNSDISSENVELTKVQQLITKDITKNYPSTPREVVKIYNEIITCFYNETYTEEELEALVDMTLLLMDEELAENNPKETYLQEVKADILEFEEAGRTIVSYTVESSNDVQFGTVGGRECATLETSYFIKEKTSYSKTYQVYMLRKNDAGEWKILGFDKIKGDTSDGE